MSKFFDPNISGKGRLFRGVAGAILLVSGALLFGLVWWLGLMLLVAGAVGVFEAVRGWCVLRACGIKTKF